MKAKEGTSTLSLAILGIIAGDPMSGYDLRKLFASTPVGHFSSSPGAIYPALRRLERLGLIAGSVKRPHALRPRKVFRITEAGRRVLVNALREAVTLDEVTSRLDRVMLRFALMDHLERHEAIAFLETLAARLDESVKYLRELQTTLLATASPCARIASEQGIAATRATARWAHWAIARLKRKEPCDEPKNRVDECSFSDLDS